MSKWVAILMLKICYKYIFGNICVSILKASMLKCYSSQNSSNNILVSLGVSQYLRELFYIKHLFQ